MLKFFKKLISPFSKIKSLLGQKLRKLFSKPLDASSFQELEQLFYEADLGASMAASLVETLQQAKLGDDYLKIVKDELLKVLKPPVLPEMTTTPHVILIVGVNGSGKTTAIAKLAAHFLSLDQTVLLAAADTFRAAATEQLEAWGNKIGAPVVKSKPGGDPAAVAFDALASAKAKGIDIVIIDTAGRLQNKTELMQELAKVRRTCEKQIPGAPHETYLVLDATTGQNALDAARVFNEFTPISGIILTKLDGSAKGGIAIAIQKELDIPISWVGLGEKETDLAPFDPESYVNALLNIS